MMRVMSKKRPTPGSPPVESEGAVQINLRVDDVRLLDALRQLSRRDHRSRNATIIVLIERGLEAAGLWPPGQE